MNSNTFNSNTDELPENLRESLSALTDGELSASESAFLLKRMQHDVALNAQWERFQAIGDALRGNSEHLHTEDFSKGVMAKIQALALEESQVARSAVDKHESQVARSAVDKHESQVARSAVDQHGSSPESQIGIAQSYPRSSGRAFRAKSSNRLWGGVALAAAVSWGALMLPKSDPARETAQSTPAPITLASPVVGIHQVSGRIGAGFYNSSDASNSILVQQGMQRFMRQHLAQSPVAPTSGAAYLAPIGPTPFGSTQVDAPAP
jgi:anti-sigma factor RsiW